MHIGITVYLKSSIPNYLPVPLAVESLIILIKNVCKSSSLDLTTWGTEQTTAQQNCDIPFLPK